MYGNTSQQKLGPSRSQKIKQLPHDTSPNQKVFPNRPKKIVSKFLVHKQSLPNQNPNYTLKR